MKSGVVIRAFFKFLPGSPEVFELKCEWDSHKDIIEWLNQKQEIWINSLVRNTGLNPTWSDPRMQIYVSFCKPVTKCAFSESNYVSYETYNELIRFQKIQENTWDGCKIVSKTSPFFTKDQVNSTDIQHMPHIITSE